MKLWDDEVDQARSQIRAESKEFVERMSPAKPGRIPPKHAYGSERSRVLLGDPV